MLRDARELAAATSKPNPGDSAEYRRAREALLAEEIELRRHLVRVAEMRRRLPLGCEPPPFRFRDAAGREVGLADMFGRHETLVTYFWMYGPQRSRPCPMCTAFLGSLDTPARDITQKVALAVIGRSPVARQLEFARERGWRNLAFYESIGDDFPAAYRGLGPDGSEWGALDVWVRRDGRVHHFWGEESMGTQDPGQDAHMAPEIMPLWNILDLTPEGRGTDWYPSLSYD